MNTVGSGRTNKEALDNSRETTHQYIYITVPYRTLNNTPIVELQQMLRNRQLLEHASVHH